MKNFRNAIFLSLSFTTAATSLASEMYLEDAIINIEMNTLAKTSLAKANDGEKCLVKKGVNLEANILGEKDGYYKIGLEDSSEVCGLSEVYIHSGHINLQQKTEYSANYAPNACKGGAFGVSTSVTGSTGTCALASLLAAAEGTKNSYHYIYSFKTFNLETADDHPRKKICAGNYCSSAAGRYQIMPDTWDTVVLVRKNLPDFREKSQDDASVILMNYRKVTNHSTIYTYTSLEQSLKKMANEWASLPGSPYGQPVITMAKAWSIYQGFTK